MYTCDICQRSFASTQLRGIHIRRSTCGQPQPSIQEAQPAQPMQPPSSVFGPLPLVSASDLLTGAFCGGSASAAPPRYTASSRFSDLGRRVRTFWSTSSDFTSVSLYSVTGHDAEQHKLKLERLSPTARLLIEDARRNGSTATETRRTLRLFKALEKTLRKQQDDSFVSSIAGLQQSQREQQFVAYFVDLTGIELAEKYRMHYNADLRLDYHEGSAQSPRLPESGLNAFTERSIGDFILRDRHLHASVTCGWRRSKISLKELQGAVKGLENFTVHPGAFKPALAIAREIIAQAGGLDAVHEYRPSIVACDKDRCLCHEEPSTATNEETEAQANERPTKRRGHIGRSSCIDSGAFETETKAFLEQYPKGDSITRKIVLLSVYEDGTALASSGAVSLSILRMQLTNVGQGTPRWVNVGLCPVVEDLTGGSTKETLAYVRRYVYAGFLNLVLKDMADASEHGTVIDGGFVYPRLYLLPVDQPAEMALLHHRKSGCDRECGHCDLKTTVASKARAGTAEARKALASIGKKLKIPKAEYEIKEKALKKATSAVKRAESRFTSLTCRIASVGSQQTRAQLRLELEAEQKTLRTAHEKKISCEEAAAVSEHQLQALQTEESHARTHLNSMDADVKAQQLQLLEVKGNPVNYQKATHYQVFISEHNRKLARQTSDFASSASGRSSDSGSSYSDDANSNDDDDSIKPESAGSDDSIESSEDSSDESEGDEGTGDVSIRQARSYLAQYCLHELPSPLAGFEGMVTGACRMNAVVGYDGLHVQAEGNCRELADGLCEITTRNEWSKGIMPRSHAIRAINLNLAQLPGICTVSTNARIKDSPASTQSGQTATLRRSLNACLPAALLGVRPLCYPDDDDVLQLSLAMADCDSRLRLINTAASNSVRTETEIDELQYNFGTMTRELCRLLQIRPKTKQHRSVFHIAQSLKAFGTHRDMDTDTNETLNKIQKAQWANTNRRKSDLAPTIAANVLSKERARSYNPAVSSLSSQILSSTEVGEVLTKNTIALCDRPAGTVRPVAGGGEAELLELSEDTARVWAQVRWAVDVADTPETAITIALQQEKHPAFPNDMQWLHLAPKVSVSIPATLEWAPDQRHRETISNRAEKDGTRRRPAVAYKNIGTEMLTIGIVLSMFISKKQRRSSAARFQEVVMVLRLQTEPASHGNKLFTEKYGHRRFSHVIEDEKVLVDVVRSKDITRQVALVPDMYHVKTELGASIDMQKAMHSYGSIRARMKYFEMRTVQISSAPMPTLPGADTTPPLDRDDPENDSTNTERDVHDFIAERTDEEFGGNNSTTASSSDNESGVVGEVVSDAENVDE